MGTYSSDATVTSGLYAHKFWFAEQLTRARRATVKDRTRWEQFVEKQWKNRLFNVVRIHRNACRFGVRKISASRP